MADDPSKKGPADRSRISLLEPYEVQYWADKFGVSPRVGRPEGERVANSAWVLINRPGCLLSSNAFEVLQAAIGGLDSPHRDYDDVDDEQPNHQRQHAREPVIQEQREHDKWRHDRRRSPDGVADAVGAKSHLSWEQLRRVNSEQDRDLDVDRDDQQEANREQAACLMHERINRSQCDRS